MALDQEACAKLVDQMMDESPWKDKLWSRCALTTAARAIRRGRHLSAEERLANIMSAVFPETESTDE